MIKFSAKKKNSDERISGYYLPIGNPPVDCIITKDEDGDHAYEIDPDTLVFCSNDSTVYIDGKMYVADKPVLKSVHKDGECVIGGFTEMPF